MAVSNTTVLPLSLLAFIERYLSLSQPLVIRAWLTKGCAEHTGSTTSCACIVTPHCCISLGWKVFAAEPKSCWAMKQLSDLGSAGTL